MEARKDLRLLALDGGGVRGLASLMILARIMELMDADHPPKPCECFDLIGGTSTGGLIAIMLGRLRMSVKDAIAAYRKLSEPVFTQQRHRFSIRGSIQGRFDDAALERGIKEMLRDNGLEEDALLKDTDPLTCRTFVCATGTYKNTVVFSSYLEPKRRGREMLDVVKIWEAARATSAATTFFSPIVVFGERCVDGATGANNPLAAILSEASAIWVPDDSANRLEDNIQCLVSIGTGLAALTKYRDDSLKQIMETLITISTDCERIVEEFRIQHPNMVKENRFLRFNVDRGLGEIGLEEWKRMDDIASATRVYVQQEKVRLELDACARTLAGTTEYLRIRLRRSLNNFGPLQHFHNVVSEMCPANSSLCDHWILHTNAFDLWTIQDHKPALCCAGITSVFEICNVLGAIAGELRKLRPSESIADSDSQFLRDPVQTDSMWIFCSPSWNLMHGLPPLSKHFSRNTTNIVWQIIAQLIDGRHPHDKELLNGMVNKSFGGYCFTEGLPHKLKVYELDRAANLVLINCHELTSDDVMRIKEFYTGLVCISRVLFLGSRPDKDTFVKHNISRVTEDTERDECLQSLFFAKVHARRDEVADAIGNTTNWIVNHQIYRKWLREPAGLLWIQGKPGSGKSVLAKRIVTEAIKIRSTTYSQTSVVADWFYSIRGGATGTSHTSMLRSILYEILYQDAACYDYFRKTYRRCRKYFSRSSNWSAEDLSHLFQQVACVKDGPPLLVILDGLDESRNEKNKSEQGSHILDLMKELIGVSDSQLKVIALSRPYPWIEQKLRKYYVITMQQENGPDIEEIISLRLDMLRQQISETGGESSDDESPSAPEGFHAIALSERDPISHMSLSDLQQQFALPCSGSEDELEFLLDEIRQSLLDRASGVILWVILVLEELLKVAVHAWRPEDMRKKLYELPSELDELYERIVSDITLANAATPYRISLAQRCLTWVIGVSDFQPLRLFELLEAIAIPDSLVEALSSHCDPILDKRFHCTAWSKFRQLIYEICGPFIEIQKREQVGRVRTPLIFSFKNQPYDVVILVHQTARDFLAKADVARDLHVDSDAAKSFVEEALLRYVDMVFPQQSTPWAAAKLFTPKHYVDDVPRAVQYLNTRFLLPYFHQTAHLRKHSSTHELNKYLLSPHYSENDVSKLLVINGPLSVFWRHCSSISEDLREVAQAWKACRTHLLGNRPDLTVAKELLRDFIDPGLARARGLYWHHLCIRIQQLDWRRWFSPEGLDNLASRMVCTNGRYHSDVCFALVYQLPRLDSGPLDAGKLSLQMLASLGQHYIHHAPDAVWALTEMMDVARASVYETVIAQIRATLHTGRAAILRWAWTREGTRHIVHSNSMDVRELENQRGICVGNLLGKSTASTWPQQTATPSEFAHNRPDPQQHNLLFDQQVVWKLRHVFCIVCKFLRLSVPADAEDHARMFGRFLRLLAASCKSEVSGKPKRNLHSWNKDRIGETLARTNMIRRDGAQRSELQASTQHPHYTIAHRTRTRTRLSRVLALCCCSS